MSTPYNRNPQDPQELIPFGEGLLDLAAEMGRGSPRRRHIIRFHELDEAFQRMLNAIEPESYTRPHRHLEPAKPEVFIALRGSALIVRFWDNGEVLEGVVIDAEGPVRGIEIPAGAWHCLVSLATGTVMFEAKEGPYVQANDKDFAAWAPPETDVEGGQAFVAGLRAHFSALVPGLAAREIIEAEEDEIL
jgi:cupin fold WbuC family metalloprotein